MANEYGYEPSGSVVGGLGQLLQMKNEEDDRKQKEASVPFLNHVLSQYLGGQQLPNYAALAPFVNAREGFSRAGANDASAGNLNSEASQRDQLTPGMITHQGEENTALGQENSIRAGSLQDLIAQPGIHNNYEQSEIGRNNMQTTNEAEQGRWIAPEAQARIANIGSETNKNNTATGLMEPEFDLSKSKLQYDMSDPNNEGSLNAARARNFDAETKMYTNPGGTQQAVPGSGIDPKTRQAVLDAISGKGVGQQVQQPQQGFGDLFDRVTGNKQNVGGVDLDSHGQVVQNAAQSQLAERARGLAGMQHQLQSLKMAIANPQPGQDPNQLQMMYDVITKKLQGGQ